MIRIMKSLSQKTTIVQITTKGRPTEKEIMNAIDTAKANETYPFKFMRLAVYRSENGRGFIEDEYIMSVTLEA